MFGLGMTEMVIIGIIAVILFGSRLPEVAKQLGGSYREFKKGLTDFSSHVDFTGDSSPSTSYAASTPSYDYDDYEEATAPKFEPPPAEPQPADEEVV